MAGQVTDKDALRALARERRQAMSVESREQARAAIRRHVLARLAASELPAGSIVAGYEPLRTEPGSTALLTALAVAGYQVLLPITLADRDLDWRLTSNPTPLGPTAIADAAAVLLPAYAVDHQGNRLGRGGGSYDRALARLAANTVTAALLFADELVESVLIEAWDRPVGNVVTPAGWLKLGPSGRGNT